MVKLPQASENGTGHVSGYEEEAIISVILDYPEFYAAMSKYVDPKYFEVPEAQLGPAHGQFGV